MSMGIAGVDELLTRRATRQKQQLKKSRGVVFEKQEPLNELWIYRD